MSSKNRTSSIDLDLDLDEMDAEDSIKEGMEHGIKKGLKKGASEGIAPLAQEAGKMAIESLAGGGRSETQSVLKDVGDAMRLQALQSTLTKMNAPTIPTSQTQGDQENKFVKLMESMAKFGVNPNDLINQMGMVNFMGMINPQMLPYLSMMNQGKQQSGGQQQNDMLPMLMMLMQQQQNQPQQPQQQSQNSNNNMMTAMMNQSQQLMQQLFQMQQENAKLSQANMYEQIKPFMQPAPTFADQMQQLEGQIQGLKSMGLMGAQGQMSDRALDLDFEAKKMAIQLERDKMQFDRQLIFEQERLKSEDKRNDMYMRLAETGQNLIKNLKFEKRPPRPVRQQTQTEAVVPDVQPETLTENISSRISNMLKIQTDDQVD